MSNEAAVLDAVAARRELIDDALVERLPIQEPERLYHASRHLIDAGGKRLRPAVTLLVAEALTGIEPSNANYQAVPTLDEANAESVGAETGVGTGDGADSTTIDVMAAATSIETIQSFTLIHDDIMDADDLRRGVPSVHRAYDDETAILAGDTLYAKAFEFMLEAGAPPERTVEALSELARTCTLICEGQSLDVAFESRTDVTTDEYIHMVEQKTAVLYAAAARAPAVLLGADDATADALYQYGLDVGRAFQIRDDVLDLTVPSEQLGKQRGSDLVEGKRTAVTLHAREQGVDVERLIDADDPEAVDEAAIDAAVARLEDAGSIEYARTLSRDLVDRGKERLDVLPDSAARDHLRGLAEYLIERGY
ncbi:MULTISPECIES: polyprenyl synthetase family protein [Halococcus]|uniref:Polyprenyl synthetase n=1 Tax=Halococcus salifodinae DSM 8989 TaxID=1227456 RepID=M0N3V4_9EURY|nr:MULTISPECIES: polyprenyl synthetase family protein [Halococcus]EMA52531.1 polyprenyl synthetase [Halococcus salifodinae DSM 8989]